MTQTSAVTVGGDPDAGNASTGGHVLTWRQRKILRVIRDSIRARGYPPSMREIADAVGLVSVNTVSYQLEILERAGYVKRDVSRRRAIELHLPRHVPPPRAPGAGRSRVVAAVLWLVLPLPH